MSNLPEHSTKRLADLDGVRILVADADAATRDLAARLLRDCGAEVVTAATADEALAAVRAHRPLLLLAAPDLPDAGGPALLPRVRALGHAGGGELPAIALVDADRGPHHAWALAAGYSEQLAKPVDAALLIATVAAIAGRDADGC